MKPTQFIIIDDDMINNFICKTGIKHVLPQMKVVDFILPVKGFSYIENELNGGPQSSSILLLDINMPEMSGWDFLEKFDLLDQALKDMVSIYILSSSIDQRDKDKAAENKYVKGYLVKPLREPNIIKIYEEQV